MKATILAVDDDKDNLLIIHGILVDSQEDYSVIIAPDGETACKLAIEKKPDLILLDWMMPGMSGLEVLEELKKKEETKDIPVLMVTSMSTSEDLKGAFEKGAIDYIRKPIDETEMLARIKSALVLFDSFHQIKTQKEQIAEEKKRVEEINLELEKISIVASKTINGVIIANAKGEIEWVNEGFTNMLGYGLEEFKKTKGATIQKASANPQIEKVISRSIEEKISVMYECENTAKDGTHLWVSSTLTPIMDHKKALRNLVVIDTDITERVMAEEALSKYFEELQRSNKELQDFANIASHDLKEPLRKILSYGNRLRESLAANVNEKEREYLLRIENAAGRMKRLIDALLKYSEITNRPEKHELIDLHGVVKEVISDLEVSISENKGKVNVGNLPKVTGDKEQMRQLFQNLISNAIKFHKPTEPPIVKIDSNGKENGFCEITIEDNGIGFDEKYLDRIFKPFLRLHSGQSYEGTGMGTAICYKICQRHGGELTARSKVWEGSTFIIKLPTK